METKVCSKCGRELPLDNFYFRKDTGKHRNKCKECEKGIINVPLPFGQRVGQIGYNKQGEKMVIIAERGAKDIDIQFVESGEKIYNKQYDNFIKGKMKHPLRYEESFAYHIIVELGLNLDDVWNWEENNKNGINPFEIYKNYNGKVWLYCQEKEYHNDNGGYVTTCNNYINGSRCSYCDMKKIHREDSLGYNYPQIAMMIAIPKNEITFEDTFKMACQSGNFYVKDIDGCGKISNEKKSLNDIIRRGYSCEYCSDGISIPNKVLRAIDEIYNLGGEFEFTKGLEGQKGDVFFRKFNKIVEADGCYPESHTGEGKKRDIQKDKKCKKLGIGMLRIDLTDERQYEKDKFNYIKTQFINSPFNQFLISEQICDLSNANWGLIWRKAQKSMVLKALELWEQGWLKKDIAKELKVHRQTVGKWLKQLGVKTQFEIKEENKQKVKELWEQGVREVEKIAEILKVTTTTIRSYLKELKLVIQN